MSRSSEQDSIDPDDPELDYSPLRLSERTAKLGPLASQTARLSERAAKLGPLASQTEDSESSPASHPAALATKAVNEPAGRTRDLNRRAAPSSIAARFASAAGAVAIVAVVALLFVIMKPASRQSVAGSTPSDITGSTLVKPAVADLKPLLASPGQPATHDQSQQSNQGDVKSKPALAELKLLLATPPSEPATHEQSQQLLQRFLQWREKADSTGASASSAQPE